MKNDKIYMRIASLLCKLDDNTFKTGSIVVEPKFGAIISSSYGPSSEYDVIDNAMRNLINVENSTLVTTFFPYKNSFNIIVKNKIKRIIYGTIPEGFTADTLRDKYEEFLEFAEKNNIEIEYIPNKIIYKIDINNISENVDIKEYIKEYLYKMGNIHKE